MVASEMSAGKNQRARHNKITENADFSLATSPATFDESVVSLFAQSSGPLSKPLKSKSEWRAAATSTAKTSNGKHDQKKRGEDGEDDIETQGSDEDDEEISEKSSSSSEGTLDGNETLPLDKVVKREERQGRKRKLDNDDLEARHLDKLAAEEARDGTKRQKNESQKTESKLATADHEASDAGSASEDNIDNEPEEFAPPPVHESLMQKSHLEDEKESRTVFLGNVSVEAIRSKSDRRTLLEHLLSCFSSATGSATERPQIESFRFRSVAFSTPIPKKAAFAKQEIMDATTRSANAYAVYSTKEAAIKAAKQLNGTIVLGRHLRVDALARPAIVDHRRCVFVGNLGYVDDESNIAAAEDENRQKARKTKPGDVEEGLWQQFNKAGRVESVRVVRDAKTRVGKGFAYVQFADQNGVEAALLFHDQKYPPLLPRKLRVVRAKKQQQSQPQHDSKPSAHSQSLQYPAKKYPSERSRFAQERRAARKSHDSDPERALRRDMKRLLGQERSNTSEKVAFKSPEQIVFEGQRASSKQSTPKAMRALVKPGKRPRVSKPTKSGSKRAAAFKAKNKPKGKGKGKAET